MQAFRLFNPEESDQSTKPELDVSEVAKLYLGYLRLRAATGDVSRGHIANVEYYLGLFAQQFRQSVSSCRQRDLLRWLDLHPRWKSGHTKKNACNAIVAAFVWAADEEGGALIDKSPYKLPKAVAAIPYVARRPADHAEYVALMRGGSRALRRALFFMRRTGCRPQDVRELLWSECHLAGPSPYILREKHKTRRATGKGKMIGLDAGTAAFLRSLRRQCDGIGHVFRNCDGLPWMPHSFCQHFSRWRERLGLAAGLMKRVTAYCLRHTYACDGIEAGVSVRKIADQLGHTTTRMVETIYGSHTRGKMDHLANVADEMVSARRRKKT